MKDSNHVRVLLLGLDSEVGVHGGSVRYLLDLRDGLEATGVRTSCIALGMRPGQRDGMTVVARHDDVLPRRVLRYAIASLGRLPKSDVVDVHFALYGFLPVLAARVLRKPIIVHFHGPWAAEAGALRGIRPSDRVRRAVEVLTYRLASEVVVLTEAFAQVLQTTYGIGRNRIIVIPPAVDLARFSPGDPKTAREALGLPERGKLVVCARRLVPRTGVDVLLEAWARLDGRSDALLVVAGVGPEEPALRELAEKRGLVSVRFLGRVSDTLMPALYRAADLSIVPSRDLEGFGLAALESFACGTPVIGTRVGGLPEALGPFAADCTVPPSNPEALARRITAALEGDVPNAEACRSHAEQFSRERLAGHHRAILRRVGALREGRVRVAYVGHSATLSGGELGLVRLLPRLEHVEPHVILGEDGPLVSKLMDRDISVEVSPMPPAMAKFRRDRGPLTWLPAVVATVRYVFQLRSLLRARRPDVVHTVSLKAALYGGIAGRLAGIPVVWSVRDRITGDYLSPVAVRLVRMAADILPQVVIANSAATALTLDGCSAPIRVIPPAAFDQLPARPRPRNARPFRIAMVGRLAPWKGQDVFLRAFAEAFAAGDETALIVGDSLFGEEEYAAGLRVLVKRLGVADRVEFLGFRDDVMALLRDAHVLVHASVLPEPFGQVVVQGMAAGIPVIAAAAGGPREIIDDGIDGFLVPPGNVGVLASRLRTLRGDEELRARLGAAGRSRAADFSPTAIAAQTELVYEDLISRRL